MINSRIEEPWTSKNEEFINKKKQFCMLKGSQHEQAGYHFKGKNTSWGLPAVLLPTVMAPLSLIINSNSEVSKYINAGAFLLTGVITGVMSFFKYNTKMTNHFNFAARYNDIVSDIELELVKNVEFRSQYDVFSMRIHMITDNLSKTEPVLPKSIVDKPQKHIYRENTSLIQQDYTDDNV
jgi:hypothetical protein